MLISLDFLCAPIPPVYLVWKNTPPQVNSSNACDCVVPRLRMFLVANPSCGVHTLLKTFILPLGSLVENLTAILSQVWKERTWSFLSFFHGDEVMSSHQVLVLPLSQLGLLLYLVDHTLF